MSHTLAETFQYASQYIRLAPLTFTTGPTGGRTGDPALSIGDWVKQFILAPPFAWRWNRATTSLTTVAGTQDYTATTAASVTMVGANQVTIASNILTVTSAAFGATTTFGAVVQFSGFVEAALLFLNGTTATVISSSGTTLVCAYSHGNLGPTAASGVAVIRTVALSNFGWLEKASVLNSGVTRELNVKLLLPEESTQNLPTQISPQIDNGSGTVTFRILPAPDKVYTVNLTYQYAASNFTATSDTWSPIPDYMYYIYSQGVMAKAFEYLGDERWPVALQLFFKQLIAFHGGLNESQLSLFMGDRLAAQLGNQAASGRTQQAVMARGLQ